MLKIVSKLPHHSGFEGYEIETDDGRKWSIRDFGGEKWAKTYEHYPKFVYESTYRGWEAYDGENIFRASSYEGLEKQILESQLSEIKKI